MPLEKHAHNTAASPRSGSLVVACAALLVGLLIGSDAASAAQAAAEMPSRRFPVAQIFTVLCLMLVPIKIIGPFAKVTKGAVEATP